MNIVYAENKEAEFMFRLFGLTRSDMFQHRDSPKKTTEELADAYHRLKKTTPLENNVPGSDTSTNRPELERLLADVEGNHFSPSWFLSGYHWDYQLRVSRDDGTNAYYLGVIPTGPSSW